MIMNDPESMRSAMPDQTYKDAAEWTLADLFGNEEYRSKVEMYYGKKRSRGEALASVIDRFIIDAG